MGGKRWKGSMAALAEVLSSDEVLLRGQNLVKGPADKLEGQKVGDSAMGEYLNLELDREEIPGRGSGY
ncbi:hypothetical protein EYZ11_000254 [Aspergillus tanneri]|uniref:Uncharacterized protein n=1 Tax=Aspergillus tanneri TaxID=1220188 RepID=A0A4S3JXV3_9EURO|nr:hypothetical protein EYZ11_000254 [Aspergillus tanneri]